MKENNNSTVILIFMLCAYCFMNNFYLWRISDNNYHFIWAFAYITQGLDAVYKYYGKV